MDLVKTVLASAILTATASWGPGQETRLDWPVAAPAVSGPGSVTALPQLPDVLPRPVPSQAPALLQTAVGLPPAAPSERQLTTISSMWRNTADATSDPNNGTSPACGIDPSCANNDATPFRVTTDAVLYHFDTRNRLPLVLNNATDAVLVDTGSLDLGYHLGPRVFATYTTEEGSGFEMGFFGVYGEDATRRVEAANSLRLPDALGLPGATTDYWQADTMAIHYAAELNSVEVNVLFAEPNQPLTVLLGGRFIRLDEQLTLTTFNDARYSAYDVRTRNDMFGIQGGGRWRQCFGAFEVSLSSTAGIYDNEALQRTFATDNNRSVVLRDDETRVAVATFVCEGNLQAIYHFSPHWSLRAGYNAMWMQGVARAPDQLDFTTNSVSGQRIVTRQEALLHGANVGVEAQW